ncbi:indole-3-glycerol phosphate synthase TrpC [Staphylococcus schleiferi subsp. coagulans]|uniref:indole-3-glycerol phosphate synthase TrpC n=1 Tax=Staphylococcus coagulans TaxID=74706 RepID=UPI0015F9ED0D|nr:indole-3-glycerol phosphate synthase TrpC [Staphylococcus coagulans]MBA8760140.1 indole-3-glycerol phosphate synthase TrpC [Staphylococcus coagulans]MBA8768871.1 indole-3-glycerol phosphate synthase TrpC [Staphylococcus coagulans]
MSILDEIITYKKVLLAEGYYEQKLAQIDAINVAHKPRLAQLLADDLKIGVIAEIKSKSPTVSDIPERDLTEQLQLYTEGGASAISVLTDERYFGGSYERLIELTQQTNLPVLCKDFIVDERQIDLAHKAGASIILLIVHVLTDAQLQQLYHYATELGLEVLVEVHDREELERAHRLNPQLIGINNRDLRRFKTDVAHTSQILTRKQAGVHYISESGIKTPADVAQLISTGIAGILVGETLMKAKAPQKQIQAFKLTKGV